MISQFIGDRRIRALAAGAACLLAAACAPAPERLAAANAAANPATPVPASAYRPVLRGYASSRPVEPAPWREQNERVAPRAKP